jgi:hypothetical protein
MHTLIPYAATAGTRCQQALDRLDLPHLDQLLRLLTPTERLEGTAQDLSPLHERVQARVLGLDGADGLIPWAADEAHRLGLTALHGMDGWAWITPCHWTIQTGHIDMADPVSLSLTPRDCDTFRMAMQPYFAEDGITLFAHVPGQPFTRWLAHGAVFTKLPTASLDRVAGRTVDPWAPRQEAAQALRRLQNEMQMLLYRHPLNDQRTRSHLAIVNAFWVSGTGTLADAPSDAEQRTPCSLRDTLRTAAFQDDAAAWVSAWRALDASTLAHDLERVQKGETLQLTLCSETHAQTFAITTLGTWEKLRRKLSPLTAREALKQL